MLLNMQAGAATSLPHLRSVKFELVKRRRLLSGGHRLVLDRVLTASFGFHATSTEGKEFASNYSSHVVRVLPRLAHQLKIDVAGVFVILPAPDCSSSLHSSISCRRELTDVAFDDIRKARGLSSYSI